MKIVGALHCNVVSLTVKFARVPRIPRSGRVEVEHVFDRFWHVTVQWGFMDSPDLSEALARAQENGCDAPLDEALFFAGHALVRASRKGRILPRWRQILFAFLHRNAVRTVDTFDLPTRRTIEIGRQVEV